jgi:3-methyl-2-oxobutanoate hydroxymethyltransferase
MDKVTVKTFFEKKGKGEKLALVTAYDYMSARIADEAGLDGLLVGDSLGMVIQGRPNTLPVTVDDIVYHTEIVSRCAKRALVIADMPFLSYQVSDEEAIENCGLMLKDAGAEAIKLEGGAYLAPLVRKLVERGIPVMGHLGLTPQSIHTFGGFAVQGRTDAQIERLKDDAKRLEEAGVFAIVLECVPKEVAKEVTGLLRVPTIGIGAGVHCDGQILVFHDILGVFQDLELKFVKEYAPAGEIMRKALSDYREDVLAGAFPEDAHSFSLKPKTKKA